VTHNLNYPDSPVGFEPWRKRLLLELEEVSTRFKPIEMARPA